ncbi:MAG: transketolase C-terminal domain-containing protein [Eubacteriales bacterium]|nr:transketolase C-terminal domain-containing protein [Eubacteriales bacterium]MDD4582833.1 transketolase C-terminal domain-containing protein [Eubacteriales bacterium]
MHERLLLDGNMAMVEAMRLCRVGVISAYPITPQSPVAEKLSEYVENGKLNAEYIRVESEHSALSCAIGAQLTGVRACTATSSVGLALMHEVLGVASGCRVPVVMGIINRALVAPWSLWCDHQDTMAERDSGWIQIYAKSVQEVFDSMVVAYRLAEHKDVQSPAMVCIDGFFLSHTSEVALIPSQEEIDDFLPPYQPCNAHLSVDNPMFVNNLIPSSEFCEMRYQQKEGLDHVKEVLPAIHAEFLEKFGREQFTVEQYCCEGADMVLVTIGSMFGAAMQAAGKLRKQGKKVGVLRIVLFRPFPYEIVGEILRDVPVVGVLDRSAGLGAQGAPLFTEVKTAAANPSTKFVSMVGGLGGRDLSTATMENAFSYLEDVYNGKADGKAQKWIDLKDNYGTLRLKNIGGNELCIK